MCVCARVLLRSRIHNNIARMHSLSVLLIILKNLQYT